MTYKIAFASSDGIHVNETFGSAAAFHIFEVTDGKYEKIDIREIAVEGLKVEEEVQPDGCSNGRDNVRAGGCESGCCGNNAGSGCHPRGGDSVSPKVELISDCRCIVCRKIGFPIHKQLERRAITAFDVTCTIDEALEKISVYFQKVDNHKSLRGIAK